MPETGIPSVPMCPKKTTSQEDCFPYAVFYRYAYGQGCGEHMHTGGLHVIVEDAAPKKESEKWCQGKM